MNYIQYRSIGKALESLTEAFNELAKQSREVQEALADGVEVTDKQINDYNKAHGLKEIK